MHASTWKELLRILACRLRHTWRPAEIIGSLQFIGKHWVVQGEVEQGTDNEGVTEAPPQVTSQVVYCPATCVEHIGSPSSAVDVRCRLLMTALCCLQNQYA